MSLALWFCFGFVICWGVKFDCFQLITVGSEYVNKKKKKSGQIFVLVTVCSRYPSIMVSFINGLGHCETDT